MCHSSTAGWVDWEHEGAIGQSKDSQVSVLCERHASRGLLCVTNHKGPTLYQPPLGPTLLRIIHSSEFVLYLSVFEESIFFSCSFVPLYWPVSDFMFRAQLIAQECGSVCLALILIMNCCFDLSRTCVRQRSLSRQHDFLSD